MEKYSNNSIMSKFIKNLLYHTYIPTCNTVTVGDFIIKGFDYVYETNLIKCTKTGYIGGKYTQDIKYGTIYGKNKLYNQYLDLTKKMEYATTYESASDIPEDFLPFSVLDIPNRTLTINYSLHKFDGTESYSYASDTSKLIMHVSDVKSNYTGLDDFKTFCNVLSKSESDVSLSYPTITLFENNDEVTINGFMNLSRVTDIASFKDWTVDNDMYISYPLNTPRVMSNLTEDEVAFLLNGIDDAENIVAFNYPVYNMIYELEDVYPVTYVTPTDVNVSRPIVTTKNGIRYTLQPDGTILINGTAIADSYFTINSDFDSTELSGMLFNGFQNSQSRVSVRITNVNYSTLYQEISENDTEIIDNGKQLYFSVFVPQGQLVNNYLLSPMIRTKDEVSDSYVVYEYPYYGIEDIKESTTNIGKYTIIRSYDWGKVYNKYTQNYISTSDYYDYFTHEYLGDFLRCYRDIKGIDLMPYYNIYNDNYISNFRITSAGLEEYYNNTFKILKVPIRYNKKYTICMDCSSEVWMCPALFVGNIPLVIKSTSGNKNADVNMTERLNEYGNYIKSFNSMSFRNPVIFEVQNTSEKSKYSDLDCAYFQQYERDLVLLIQMPIVNNSSIVILEGNYTDTNSDKIIDNTEAWQLHDTELNKVFCSNLSLMQLNCKENYVYSDRLIEYLLLNVITSQDTIDGNVEYIQQLSPVLVPHNYTVGIWNNYTRSKLFRYSINHKNTKGLDFNGFVDKDTEDFLIHQIFTY